jgi:hypothetical protein
MRDREGVGAGGHDPNNVCTYGKMNKKRMIANWTRFHPYVLS